MSKKAFMVATMLLWVNNTPLGTPVLPEVYIKIAKSSFVGGVVPENKSFVA